MLLYTYIKIEPEKLQQKIMYNQAIQYIFFAVFTVFHGGFLVLDDLSSSISAAR